MNFEIISPNTIKELLGTVKKFQKKKFRFGAGCTDLLMELRKKQEENLTIINLSQINNIEFSNIKKSAKQIRLGAMLTVHKIVINEEIKNNFPVLHESALNLASTQIRQVATVGGNLCTASPSGDVACALVALEAQCEVMGINGKIKLFPITEFQTGPRKTVMKINEILFGITIPVNHKSSNKTLSKFIKIGTRRSMECSVVSLAYHIQLDNDGKIIKAGIAIGASAPTIRYAKTACEFLVEKNIKNISEKEKEELADKILSYASPITDIRATAWYRKEVLHNISKAIFE